MLISEMLRVALVGIGATLVFDLWLGLLQRLGIPTLELQPAMGAGLAGSKTPTPVKNCARSIVNHAVFGIGLYLSAVAVAGF